MTEAVVKLRTKLKPLEGNTIEDILSIQYSWATVNHTENRPKVIRNHLIVSKQLIKMIIHVREELRDRTWCKLIKSCQDLQISKLSIKIVLPGIITDQKVGAVKKTCTTLRKWATCNTNKINKIKRVLAHNFLLCLSHNYQFFSRQLTNFQFNKPSHSSRCNHNYLMNSYSKNKTFYSVLQHLPYNQHLLTQMMRGNIQKKKLI